MYLTFILCTENRYKQQNMYIKVWSGCQNIAVCPTWQIPQWEMRIMNEGSLTRPLQMSVLYHCRDPATKLSSWASPWSHPSWLYRAGGHLGGHSWDQCGSSATAFFWLDEGNVAVRRHVPNDFVKPLFEPGTRGKWINTWHRDLILPICLVQVAYHVLQWHAYFIEMWFTWDHFEQLF